MFHSIKLFFLSDLLAGHLCARADVHRRSYVQVLAATGGAVGTKAANWVVAAGATQDAKGLIAARAVGNRDAISPTNLSWAAMLAKTCGAGRDRKSCQKQKTPLRAAFCWRGRSNSRLDIFGGLQRQNLREAGG